MSLLLRLTVLVAAGCAALATASGALAAYAPRLVVDPASASAGASGAITVSFVQPVGHLATARVTVYAPAGTTAAHPAPGAAVGTANATGIVQPIGGIPLTMSGKLTAADPAEYQSEPCAPGLHDQVWLLTLSGSGQTLTVPIFIDPAAGADTALGAVKLDFCLDSPLVAGRVALVGLDLHVASNRLRAPARAGELVWRSFFTPYPEGATAPDPAAAVESRAILRQPLQLTLLGKLGKRGKVTLFGSFKGGGRRLVGVTVSLLAGTTPRRLRAVSSTRTGRAGGYSFSVKLEKTRSFQTRVLVPARDITASACKAASAAPGGCVTATAQPFHLLSSTAVKVVVR